MTPPVPAGLIEAFWAYERALMSNDLAELDRLFAPGPTTLRGDAAGLLVGHDAIRAFRGGRGGAPGRRIVQTHVQTIDEDHALVVAITELDRGGRGQQTQAWARLVDGWAVTAAHVAVPAPALDTRIWRVLGDPLLPATGRSAGTGPRALEGETIAVKDLYAVAGHRRGAGNPAWLAAAPVETEHAAALGSLLAAGAAVRGIAQTDEFAYSLAGTNAHSGTPPNPRAPYRISGGSTSGPATAVSLGQASIALGTDTGGSVRVPAAYQGLFGIRTSHDLLDRTGLIALAPSFDTVGWLTRSATLLREVGEVLVPPTAPATTRGRRLVRVPGLDALAEPDVVAALAAVPVAARVTWPLEELSSWLGAFQAWQAWQAWQVHGDWLTDRLDTLGPDVRVRFDRAASLTHAEAQAAWETVARAGRLIRDLVGDDVVVLPSASSVAPRLGADYGPVRTATMSLTIVAGLAGLPAVGLPLTTAEGLPCGACLVAAPGRDRDLLELAVELALDPTGTISPSRL